MLRLSMRNRRCRIAGSGTMAAFGAVAGIALTLALAAIPAVAQVDALDKPDGAPINPLLQPLVEDDQGQRVLSAKEQAVRSREIYEATKTAKTLTDFQQIAQRCEQTLAFQLGDSNRDYVRSLNGWALNRCGEKRCELARQMREIGSVQRYRSALEQSLQDFVRASQLAPQRHRTWNSWAIALMLDQQWQAAIVKLDRAIEGKADYTAAWFNRAECHAQLESWEQAIDDYSLVVRMDSDDLEALTGRGLAYLALQQMERAGADLTVVIERQPESANAWVNHGDWSQASGDWDLAVADYQRAIQLDGAGTGRQRLAWLRATCPDAALRDPAEAIALIEAAIESGSPSVSDLETLAAARAAQGNYPDAAQAQRQAIGLVGAESEDDGSATAESPSRVRLALYEDEQPFVQPALTSEKR